MNLGNVTNVSSSPIPSSAEHQIRGETSASEEAESHGNQDGWKL